MRRFKKRSLVGEGYISKGSSSMDFNFGTTDFRTLTYSFRVKFVPNILSSTKF